MLKIGNTSTTITFKIRESNQAVNFEYDNKVIKQKSYFGHHNFSIIGVNKENFRLVFQDIEKVDFEAIKSYVIPFVSQEMWVEYTNELGITNYTGFSFIEMTEVKFDYNQTKYSFELNIYEM